MSSSEPIAINLEPSCNQRLKNLCGPCNSHLQQLENQFDVIIRHNNHHFQVVGNAIQQSKVSVILQRLYKHADKPISPKDISQLITQKITPSTDLIHTRLKKLNSRNENQTHYLTAIAKHDLNFAIGPAGTGKTYLAVAKAVEALDRGDVQRLIFVRPAVEAGEKLGFLPGDLVDKVLPYLRPIYDALYELLGFDEVQKLIAQDIIEIAPLAFMRGRTLNDAFIILDEAQNTTQAQMKMFLTRLGFGSTAIITGDITQVDLPHGTPSGLAHATRVLKNINQASITYFTSKDVVRHPLVSDIIDAYEQSENK